MRREKKPLDIEFVSVPCEDIIGFIGDAFEPNLRQALAKHGAYLKIPLSEYLREHAQVHMKDSE
ncbi:hypothetical protein NSS79_15145 [Paenibacillus sp. FSL L8-0436]|uniref:hypothetical protein n=1 Tax=Paenibacillus sp. FSL L8-0436 TaxID=2954686 RepID=UPI003159709C